MGVIGGMVALAEDPEAIPTHRMGCVVVEFVELNLVGTIVHCPGRTIRNFCRSQPEAEMCPSSTSIVPEFVVRIDNPETCWVNVGVQKGIRHSGEHGQIIL